MGVMRFKGCVRNARSGFTLGEVALALVCISVVTLGAASVRFHAARHITQTDLYTRAVSTNEMILAAWSVCARPEGFNPVDLSSDDDAWVLTIEADETASGPEPPQGYTVLNDTVYTVTWGDIQYLMTLAYQQTSETEPVILAVGVGWRQSSLTREFSETDPVVWLRSYQ